MATNAIRSAGIVKLQGCSRLPLLADAIALAFAGGKRARGGVLKGVREVDWSTPLRASPQHRNLTWGAGSTVGRSGPGQHRRNTAIVPPFPVTHRSRLVPRRHDGCASSIRTDRSPGRAGSIRTCSGVRSIRVPRPLFDLISALMGDGSFLI